MKVEGEHLYVEEFLFQGRLALRLGDLASVAKAPEQVLLLEVFVSALLEQDDESPEFLLEFHALFLY